MGRPRWPPARHKQRAAVLVCDDRREFARAYGARGLLGTVVDCFVLVVIKILVLWILSDGYVLLVLTYNYYMENVTRIGPTTRMDL